MDPDRLRAQLAPPMACLFLILIPCVFVVQMPVSTGIRMPVMRLSPNRARFTCDGRFVFIQLLADGKTKINGTEIHPEDLAPRIATTMESRAERVVYLVPDSRISYARFVQVLGELDRAAADMHIAVLSGSVRNEYFERNLEPCDIILPN
jgi:biopolymer transport protein ExbD